MQGYGRLPPQRRELGREEAPRGRVAVARLPAAGVGLAVAAVEALALLCLAEPRQAVRPEQAALLEQRRVGAQALRESRVDEVALDVDAARADAVPGFGREELRFGCCWCCPHGRRGLRGGEEAEQHSLGDSCSMIVRRKALMLWLCKTEAFQLSLPVLN